MLPREVIPTSSPLWICRRLCLIVFVVVFFSIHHVGFIFVSVVSWFASLQQIQAMFLLGVVPSEENMDFFPSLALTDFPAAPPRSNGPKRSWSDMKSDDEDQSTMTTSPVKVEKKLKALIGWRYVGGGFGSSHEHV